MNPVLKKLRNRKLSPSDIADLLERHIGDGLNEAHCRDACDALHTIGHEKANSYARVIKAMLDYEPNKCEIVKSVILALRSEQVTNELERSNGPVDGSPSSA